MAARLTRRRFLKLAALGALAAGCASPPPGPGRPAAPWGAAAEPAPTQTPGPATEHRPPASPTLVPPPDSIRITPLADFYKQSFSSIPTVEADSWRLTIDGLVHSPMVLTLAEVRARPAVEIMRTLECIGNPVGGPLIGNAVWKGTYLKPLLDTAGIRPGARRIKFAAADGYDTAVELRFIDDPLSFLAYDMNGAPLTQEHGFPLRVFFPGSYGQKMPKWVTRMEVIDYDHEGYWEREGWSDVAQVKTNSIIEQPYANAALSAQPLAIWGVAYAGKRDIVKVEVKVAEDDWREADRLHGPTSEVWTQWVLEWRPPAAGRYKIAVRATDSTGFTQHNTTAGVLDGFPDGSDAIHSIFVKVA